MHPVAEHGAALGEQRGADLVLGHDRGLGQEHRRQLAAVLAEDAEEVLDLGVDVLRRLGHAVDLDRGDRVVSMPADAVVIATGGFASGGIVLDSHGGLTEAVADLPLAGDPGPERRFGERASDDHPGLAVGVTVDAGMHPLNPDGSVWADNVYAAGDIIGGAVPWRQLCGEGICLGSAAVAADTLVRELAATVREV